MTVDWTPIGVPETSANGWFYGWFTCGWYETSNNWLTIEVDET